MRYHKEIKSVISVSIPAFIGCLIGSIGMPYILSKDNSMIGTKLIGSIIGISLFSIVKFIIDVSKKKKNIAN